MSSSSSSPREIVGTFGDRGRFQAAVDALTAAGFDRGALSVLSSHAALDTAQGTPGWRERLVGLVGELKYEGPLIAAGLIALAAGPVGAAIAALVAAGVGTAAARELLSEIAAVRDPDAFARALAAGSVILWVAVADGEQEAKANRILAENGADDVHPFERTPR